MHYFGWQDQWTPLAAAVHRAVWNTNDAIVHLLLEKSVDVNTPSKVLCV